MGMWWDNYGGTFKNCFKARQQKAEVFKADKQGKVTNAKRPSLSLSLSVSLSHDTHMTQASS